MNTSELIRAMQEFEPHHVCVPYYAYEHPEAALEFVNAHREYEAATAAFDPHHPEPEAVGRFNEAQRRVKAADNALAVFSRALHEQWAKEDAKVGDGDDDDDELDMEIKLALDQEAHEEYLLENDPEALDDDE